MNSPTIKPEAYQLVYPAEGLIFKGMKRRHLLPLALFLCVKPAAAQDSVTRLHLLVSPALFTPVAVAAQAGLLYRFPRRKGILLEGAYPTFYPQTDYEKVRYWRVGAELRMYVKTKADRSPYYAFQASYLKRTLTDRNFGLANQGRSDFAYDSATIQSPVLSAAVKMGVELGGNSSKTFVDVFLGLGVRRLFNQYQASNLRPITRDRRSGWNIIPTEGWRSLDPLTRFHLTAGLRFGWAL